MGARGVDRDVFVPRSEAGRVASIPGEGGREGGREGERDG